MRSTEIAPQADNLIGFCIPTYKRPELLEKTLLSIARAARRHPVRIYISDDSCSAVNEGVVRRFQKRYPHVEYHQNRTNLGIDGNVQQAVEMCACDYAWILGEDDRVTLFAVDEMVETIRGFHDPPFVFANYVYVDNRFRYLLSGPLVPVGGRPRVIPAEEMLAKWAWTMGFIGSCVIRKSFWDAASGERYLHTYYNHVGRVMEAIRSREVVITGRVLVLNRAENTQSFTWASRAFDVYYGWETMLNRLGEVYGRETVDTAERNSRRLFNHRSLKWVMSKRADGVYDYGVFRRYILPGNAHGAGFKLAAAAIARVPAAFFVPLKFMAKTLPVLVRRRPIPRNWLN